MILRKCLACRMGKHKWHRESQPDPRNPHPYNNRVCGCEGECDGKPEPNPLAELLAKAYAERINEKGQEVDR